MKTRAASFCAPAMAGLSFGLALAALGCTPMPPSAGHDAGGSPSGPGAVPAAATEASDRPQEAERRGPEEPRAGGALAAPAAAGGAGKPAVVVELFTSEGCSSCPPADDLLREMAAEARAAGKPVFLLSFHVDYWNELGWPDPFSSRVYTDRQNHYARAFSSSGVYTPQMIIGGRDAFVGSSRARAESGLTEALAKSAQVGVALKAKASTEPRAIDVTYAVTGAPPGAVLNVALVEDGLVVRVPRGENAGKTLLHDSVVRLFRVVSLDRSAEGALSFAVPEGVARPKASLIAYAQSAATLEILGASGAPVEP